MTPHQIADATYAAMLAPPPYVQLATSLLAAETNATRAALLDASEPIIANAAMQYLAEPETTRERERRLAWMRADPRRVAALRLYYAGHLADFISDFGVTVDPRSIAKGKTALVPFVLWPKQRELVAWMLARWRGAEPGTVVKSRDVGASWVAMSLLASLCIFERNFAAGVASATEVKLDRSGDPDTLFYKLREFLKHLPPEFNAGYVHDKHSAYLRVNFPETDSSITGEAGDQAGRGGRKSLYIVDESAHFLHPKLIDASLAATTDCRIDMSSVNGIGNSFYERAHNPNIPRFELTWRDDPRKGEAWYAKQVATLDPLVLAQEVNADFSASREGVVIPSAWVQSAIGLAEKLGLTPTGARYASLDLGDTGDRSALAARHGVYLEHLESWSGAGSNLMRSAAKAFTLCDQLTIAELLYDADGLGASMRGDAEALNETRDKKILVVEYRGSSSPLFPARIVPRSGRKWADLVANRKAQAWWHLRMLFEQSHRAANGEPYDADNIICINAKLPELSRLVAELSQPTMSENTAGKLLIDKLGEGERSPNLGDAVCMVFAPRVMPMKIHPNVLRLFTTAQGGPNARLPPGM